jgi:predicted secreted protein
MGMHETPGRDSLRGTRRTGLTGPRAAVLTVLLLLGAAACSKAPTNTQSTPTPVISAAPSPTPKVTATVAASPSAVKTPVASPTTSPRPVPTSTATSGVTTTVQISSTSGSSLNAKVGQVLTLTLAQASDGGYTWAFTTQPNSAILAVSNQQTLPPASPLPAGSAGGSTRYRATFTAVAPGTTSFTLNETQSGNPQAAMTYSLTVVVS